MLRNHRLEVSYFQIDPHYSAQLIFIGSASVSLIPKFINPPCTLIDPFLAGTVQHGVVPPSLVYQLSYQAKSTFFVGQNNDSTVGC